MAAPLRGCDVFRRRPEGPQAGTRAGVAGDVPFRAPYTETGFNVKHGRPWAVGAHVSRSVHCQAVGLGCPAATQGAQAATGCAGLFGKVPATVFRRSIGCSVPETPSQVPGDLCLLAASPDRGPDWIPEPVFDESMRLLGRNRLNMKPREVARLLSPELLPDAFERRVKRLTRLRDAHVDMFGRRILRDKYRDRQRDKQAGSVRARRANNVERDALILTLAAEGVSVAATARLAGCARTTVYRTLERSGGDTMTTTIESVAIATTSTHSPKGSPLGRPARENWSTPSAPPPDAESAGAGRSPLRDGQEAENEVARPWWKPDAPQVCGRCVPPGQRVGVVVAFMSCVRCEAGPEPPPEDREDATIDAMLAKANAIMDECNKQEAAAPFRLLSAKIEDRPNDPDEPPPRVIQRWACNGCGKQAATEEVLPGGRPHIPGCRCEWNRETLDFL